MGHYKVHVHFLPMGIVRPPCGIGTGKVKLFEYDVTSVASKVTCVHCLAKMKESK